MTNRRAVTVLVLVGIVALYLSLLSTVGIFDPEEGRHVSVATAMLRTGDFVVPQLQGFPYLEKPPLAYWLIAASFRALGRSELAARLPVAIMGLAGIAATFLVARIALGTTAALFSAGVLALSTQWFAQSRYMTTDMIVSGWVTIAIAFFFAAHATGRRPLYLGFFAATAIATLAKGLVGLALPCGIVAVFVLWTRRLKIVTEMRPIAGSLLFLAIVLPWFLLVERRIPDFLRYFVVDQHVARFVGSAREHPAPIWFFVPVIAFGFFPWIVHLPAAAARFGRSSDLSKLLWAWFGVIFVFFSAAQEKLMGYVLPAYPPLAILIGGYLAQAAGRTGDADTGRRIGRAALVAGVVWLALAPVSIAGLRRFMAADGRLSIEEVGVWPWALAAIYAAAGAALLAGGWLKRWRPVLVASAVAQVLAFAVFVGGAAAADDELGTRPIGESLAQMVRPEDAVVLYRVQQPSAEFYLGRPPFLYGWTGEHAWGMKVRPDPSLAASDPDAVKSLLASSKTVYVVTRAGDHAADGELGVPLALVTGNRKRTVYRNHPAEAP
jgi:4-amino-4-deoxy-L-arabinose transferase-like glycosyltransferase